MSDATYGDYSAARKLYVDHKDMNSAYGGSPMPSWENLSEDEKEVWRERAESDGGKGFLE